jgi:hypothetical protein
MISLINETCGPETKFLFDREVQVVHPTRRVQFRVYRASRGTGSIHQSSGENGLIAIFSISSIIFIIPLAWSIKTRPTSIRTA